VGSVVCKHKIFNELPASTAEFVNDKKHFILALKRFSIAKSFYSINEWYIPLYFSTLDSGKMAISPLQADKRIPTWE